MSYDILYDTQFIKTSQGITPAILSGPSNVWEPGNVLGRRTERRARDWALYGNMLCATGEELIAKIESCTGGPYQEHWMQNGKWMDDEGIRRWVRNGIKNAATVEEILAANPAVSIRAHLSVWPSAEGSWSKELMPRYIKSTDDLEVWITDVRFQTKEILEDDPKASIYPVIGFSTEKLNRPKANGKTPQEVVFRLHGKYVAKIENGNSVHYTRDIHGALRFPYEQALDVKKEYLWALHDATMVNASAADAPYDAVIKLSNGHYIASYSGRKATLARSQSGAKKYRDTKAAEKALERLESLLKYNGLTAEVETAVA